MKPRWPLLLVLLSSAARVRGYDDISGLEQLPTCASECLASAVAKSSCSATNETCICADDFIKSKVTLCITSSCSIKEALTSKNLTATQCNEPVRNKSGEYEAISDTFGILSGIFVALRFGFKLYAHLELGLDDWFTLITIIVGVPSTVLAVYGTIANGLGQDVWVLPFDEITSFGKYFYVMSIIYFAEVALLKLAFLFFYLRIFPAKPIRRILWGTVVVNCIFGIVFVAAAIFQCRPVNAAFLRWDGEYPSTCINLNALGWSNAAISIILDIWMLAIPLSQLKGLRLNWKKKVGVGLMMSVGAFVTVVSILRLQSLVKYGTHSLNPTWEYFEVSKWSTIEINVGIICSCMPTMRLILVRMFPKQMGTTQRDYSDYANRPGGQGKSKTRTFGATATADRSHNRTESRGITLHRTYAVEYGDSDEAQLVHMQQLDKQSTKSAASYV